MTIKEAILKSLDKIGGLTNYLEVTQNITDKKYYDFKEAKTPYATVSALLGDFIRNGDTRIKRIKQSGGYLYYLTKNESLISIEKLSGEIVEDKPAKKSDKRKTYEERSLHKLLSAILKILKYIPKRYFMNNQMEKTITKFGHIQISLE